MRRVPKLSVAHFAYIVVTIYDLSSAHTSHIFNRIKFALRFLRYLGIAHSKAGWKIRPPSRKIEVSKYNEKGVLEWMK